MSQTNVIIATNHPSPIYYFIHTSTIISSLRKVKDEYWNSIQKIRESLSPQQRWAKPLLYSDCSAHHLNGFTFSQSSLPTSKALCFRTRACHILCFMNNQLWGSGSWEWEQKTKANLCSSTMEVYYCWWERLKQTNKEEWTKSDRLLISIWNILYYSQALVLCSVICIRKSWHISFSWMFFPSIPHLGWVAPPSTYWNHPWLSFYTL